MAQDARALEREIEVTRARLDTDVDALADKVDPRNVARRTAQGAKERIMSTVGTARDSVMGTASGVSDRAAGTASELASRTQGLAADTASAATDTVNRAAETAGGAATAVRRQTEGSPLVAGLVAFGVGWIASALIPASKAEERLAAQAGSVLAEHSEALQAVSDHARSVATDVGGQVTSAAQEAAQAVQQTARDAAQHVVEDAKDAKDGMTGH
jgi:hypothetical protein